MRVIYSKKKFNEAEVREVLSPIYESQNLYKFLLKARECEGTLANIDNVVSDITYQITLLYLQSYKNIVKILKSSKIDLEAITRLDIEHGSITAIYDNGKSFIIDN